MSITRMIVCITLESLSPILESIIAKSEKINEILAISITAQIFLVFILISMVRAFGAKWPYGSQESLFQTTDKTSKIREGIIMYQVDTL